MLENKFILDACCGGRMFWFDREHQNTLYIDNRIAEKGHVGHPHAKNHEVKPDIVMDFRDLKFKDKSFKLVVFDPPHLFNAGDTSYMFRKYGRLNKETWEEDIKKGFEECWRVLKDYGVLIFKWNEQSVTIGKVLKIISQKPLFGHPTAKHGKTKWCVFMKIPLVEKQKGGNGDSSQQ